jgi:tetratricopeptide (TPR) repeat protein
MSAMSMKRRLRRTIERGRVTSVTKQIDGCEITFSKMNLVQHPDEVEREIERLHSMIHRSPREAIEDLHALIERHPHIPMLRNYLAIAYSSSGDQERAEREIEENIRLHPDYLFARLNHAETCIARGDLATAAELLGGPAPGLRALYPHRKRFHISEYVGFMYALGIYYVEMGDRAAAERVYERLRAVGPDERATCACTSFCIIAPSRSADCSAAG